MLIHDRLAEINLRVQESFEASADLPFSEVTNLDRCPEGTYFSHQLCLECPTGHL